MNTTLEIKPFAAEVAANGSVKNLYCIAEVGGAVVTYGPLHEMIVLLQDVVRGNGLRYSHH